MTDENRRFQAIFNDPNLLVGLLDTDGTIERINETAADLVDIDPEDAVGKKFWEGPWWTTETESRVKSWIDVAASGEYVEFEAEHPRKGATTIVSGIFRPVTNTNGDVTTIVVSAREVTERRQQRLRLREQNHRFDKVASFISHDLESPLSVATGQLELALKTGELKHVDRALDAIERVNNLREDVVTTLRSREIVEQLETVEVNAVIEETWREIDPPAQAALSIEDEWTTVADPEALGRLFENLLRNSIEHAGNDVAIQIGMLENGFYYADDGPGIDQADRRRVFIPGFSTKTDEKGIGMGLASVRQIVTAHDWQIEITDSGTLGGARFEIQTG